MALNNEKSHLMEASLLFSLLLKYYKANTSRRVNTKCVKEARAKPNTVMTFSALLGSGEGRKQMGPLQVAFVARPDQWFPVCGFTSGVGVRMEKK